MELRTIIFDFDGTLAYLNIDFNEMRRRVLDLFPEFGLGPELLEDRHILEGIEAAAKVLKMRKGDGSSLFEARAEEVMVRMELAAAQKSFLLPGISEALVQLKARGLRLGIITRNSAPAVNVLLSNRPLPHDVLLCREDVERDKVKPHPEHLQRALQMLNERSDTCLMVGDHPLDIRVAKRAGAHSAGVLTGRHSSSDLEAEGADMVLGSVKELPGLFERSALRVTP